MATEVAKREGTIGSNIGSNIGSRKKLRPISVAILSPHVQPTIGSHIGHRSVARVDRATEFKSSPSPYTSPESATVYSRIFGSYFVFATEFGRPCFLGYEINGYPHYATGISQECLGI